MDKNIKSKKQTFESAREELETIVESMENNNISLEDSLKNYKKGVQLLKFCYSELEDAQQQIKILENDHLKKFEIDKNKT